LARDGGARPDNGRPRWLGRDDEPPVRPPLTRRRIVLAALALVEEQGLDALTMRRLASELGVTPMSLYNHVSDKAELIDLMVDLILADVVAEPLDDDADWAEQLRTVARRTYRTWRAHPGFARVYTDGVTIGPNGLANIEQTLGAMRRAGFTDEDAARAFFVLYQCVMSSLLIAPARPASLQARDQRSDGSAASRIELYFSALPEEDIPNVTAVAGYLAGNDFEFGLEVVIAGFQARLETARQASPEAPGTRSRAPKKRT
jgi:TetR/AcrR family transcriptional regulator, tetracycline repressor protein